MPSVTVKADRLPAVAVLLRNRLGGHDWGEHSLEQVDSERFRVQFDSDDDAEHLKWLLHPDDVLEVELEHSEPADTLSSFIERFNASRR